MESMRDVLQSIGKLPASTVLKTFTCDGCGQKVRQTQFVQQGGPWKGSTFVKNVGCECEDNQLAESAMRQEANMLRRKAQDMFDENSLINQSLQKASFETYQPTSPELQAAKQTVMRYVSNFDSKSPCNLLLFGSYGTGKSHLAVSAVKELMTSGRLCLFLSVPKLLTKIKNTYNRNSKFSEDDILNFVQKVDLLVLDDVGTEYTNMRDGNDNWTQTKLFEVMDSRAGKHTIYTTNLQSGELKQKVNPRNFSRMMENTEIIKMNGRDYREKQF